MGALDGLRVIELGGQVSAAYASKLLADLGAEVVKLEPAGGDPLRCSGPWEQGIEPDPRRGGALFRYLNGGKRSMLFDPDGALGLLAASDVIIESLGPGGLEEAGLALEQLEVRGFRGGLVRISDFGQEGPYRDVPASPLTLQAMAGWVSAHGIPGQHPVQVGGRISEYAPGAFAGCAALTAWRGARDLGRAVWADLSVMECLVGTLAYPMLFDLTLRALGLPPPEARYAVLPGIVRCADGWAGINALTGQHWADICSMFDVEEFAAAQRELGWGGELLDRFFARIQPMLDTLTVEEVVELSQAFRVPAAPVGDGASLTRLAQFRERPFFVREEGGGATVPGPPYRLCATPASAGRRAPRLGADRVVWVPRRPEPRPVGAPEPDADGAGHLPFGGVRVLDMGTFWAGPYVGLYLGSLGADVIKIESCRRPDGFRFSAAFPQEGWDWYERSGLWQATNLNKRDVTLELATAEGVELLRRLIVGADVLIENFSPRVLEQFGLGYEGVRAITPDIVMIRMPGFGLEGPWRDYVGWAMGFEQASGMAQVTGDGSRPVNPGGFLDPVVGMHAALALQAALEHRSRTGEGQMVEVAQVETGACLTAEQVIEWSLTGRILAGEGNRSSLFAPQGVYPAAEGPARDHNPVEALVGRPATRRRWVAISAQGDAEWERLARAIGRPDWADDPALATLVGRYKAHDAIDAAIAEWTLLRSPEEVVAALRPLGIAVGALLTAAEMYDDPQLQARGYFQPMDHPRTGVRRYPGWPMQFSCGPRPPHRCPAPTLGQHNDEVLGGLLGLGAAELAVLRRRGVIGEGMPD